MKRRSFFAKGILASLGLTSGFRLLASQKEKPVIEGPFAHMVFFWLKDTTDVEAFKQGTAQLMNDIDLVVSYHIGEPAGTPREVVDNSYSLCLISTFATKEDQDAYQVHPKHVQYVGANKDKWERVLIYDSWAGCV